MKNITRWISVASLAAVAGCSPASVGGGGGAGTGGSGASGEPDACAAYTDLPAATNVLIRIVNQRSTPVYVDTDCGIALDLQAGGVIHPGAMRHLEQTCFAMRSQGPVAGDCASAGIAIQPGASWETHWSGLYYDTTKMPATCYFPDPQTDPLQRACQQPVVAAPGPVRALPWVYASSSGSNVLWPTVSDRIPVGKDFVLGVDTVVEVDVP